MDTVELNEVKGGAISGTFVKNVLDIFEFIHDLGRKMGSAIRRKKTSNYC